MINPYPDESSARVWRRGWALLSLLFGLAGAALAFSPIGPVGVTVGGIGIAEGALALLRVRPTLAGRVLAVTGTVISSLAVTVTLLMAVAQPQLGRGSPPVAPTGAVSTDVDAVLADELSVRFGKITSDSLWPTLIITLTNKLDVVRQCDLEVGAFTGPREQVLSARVVQKSSRDDGIVLDAHATVETTAELRSVDDDTTMKRLDTADFRVITATCGPFDYRLGT